MSELFAFEPWQERPVSLAPGNDLTEAEWRRRMSPHTDPAPMDPNWCTNYDPAADQVMHESYRADVEALKPLLKAELHNARAPLTGRETACVLTTQQGVYVGHCDEQEGSRFITAPAMALAKLGEAEAADAEITGIYLMGRNIKKPKYVMPTPEDYDRLAGRFVDWGPTIIIVDPDSSAYTSVWASVHGPAYSVKEPSDFRYLIGEDEDTTTLPSLIRERTVLDWRGADFIAHLMQTGKKRDIEIYLTGSASGRGEISNALKGDYEDIDLLVVTGDNDLDEVEEVLTARAEKYFGPLRRQPMTSYDYETGRAFPGISLYDLAGNKKIQLHIGATMDDINYRPVNLERNFFHRVS